MNKAIQICLIALMTLLITGTLSAQVTLINKSTIMPEQPNRSITGLPVLTQNTMTGEVMLVWWEGTIPQGASGVLVGRIVDVQGKEVGHEFTIDSKPLLTKDHFNGDGDNQIAYNSGTNEYLVVHEEGHEDQTGQFGRILAQKVTNDGKLQGTQLDLTSRFSALKPYDNKSHIIKFNPVTGGYAQFAQRHTIPAKTTTVAFFEMLNSLGNAAKPPAVMNGPYFPEDFIFLPSGKILMAQTQGLRKGNERDYIVTTVNPTSPQDFVNLTPEKWTFVARSTKTIPSERPGTRLGLPSPDSPILYFTDDVNVMGQQITADAKPSGPSFKALNPPATSKRLFISSVAFSQTSHGVTGILIALDDPGFPNGPVAVWAQRLDGRGMPVGPSKRLFTTLRSERIEMNQVVALVAQPGDSVARFTWYGVKSGSILKFNLTTPLP